jgi:hypothetical protein
MNLENDENVMIQMQSGILDKLLNKPKNCWVEVQTHRRRHQHCLRWEEVLAHREEVQAHREEVQAHREEVCLHHL